MVIFGLCRPFREGWNRASEWCTHLFPCLADPGRRSSLGLKSALVALHLIFLGGILLLDRDLVEKARKDPWQAMLYLLLFVATLCQYFFTSGSSPGYVIDAMRAVEEASLICPKSTVASKQPASSKTGSVVISIDGNQMVRDPNGSHPTSWAKLAMGMYPPASTARNWTCTYCAVVQPPRAKHCHDCDKCVLQFDHHCVWLGTCIGQGNHCRFWWYILEESALSLWTNILYLRLLKAHISKSWWISAIVILILVTLSAALIFLLLLLIFHSYLVLTNQTTYELVRRRRIPYLRGVPERVYPFSKGACRNVYGFCCARRGSFHLEALPTRAEYDAMSAPYSCLDFPRCCCC